MEVILACTKDFGVGVENGLPWRSLEELDIFRKKTWGNVVIMGRKTIEHLPKLKERTLICLSRTRPVRNSENEFEVFDTIASAFLYAAERFPDKKIFIAGGASVYNQVLNEGVINIKKLHISIFKGNKYRCTSFVKFPFKKWTAISIEKYEEFNHYEMIYDPCGEYQYSDLLNDVLRQGSEKVGRNGLTFSQFVRHLTFDLKRGFPLITGKKMFFRGIVEELLFFLRGETDTSFLENKGIRIWNKNTSQEFLTSQNLDYKPGLFGPLYGWQWRFFNRPYDNLTGSPANSEGIKNIDQLAYVINLIKTDPSSRRILMTSYNPAQADQGVLYPCHSLMVQFYVTFDEITRTPKNLNMYCFNRSSDLFLGLPFNIASSALLLMIVAKCTDLKPKFLHLTLGDAHIYESHVSAVCEYISRGPYFKFPKLTIIKDLVKIEDINSLSYDDFQLENYRSYEAIPAEMVA